MPTGVFTQKEKADLHLAPLGCSSPLLRRTRSRSLWWASFPRLPIEKLQQIAPWLLPSYADHHGINGCGHIGRLAFRAAIANPRVEVEAACDPLMDFWFMAYQVKYDSVHIGFLAPSPRNRHLHQSPCRPPWTSMFSAASVA